MTLEDDLSDFIDRFWRPKNTVFTLIDGARSSFSAPALRSRDALPLFRQETDNLVDAGPWMICSSRHEELSNDLVFANSLGGGVCWSGRCGSKEAIAHFRRLNAALLPHDRLVLFRHYDADVLASIAPLLDGLQAAQLFGPFELFGFLGGRGSYATVEKPNGLPEPSGGPIYFSEDQVRWLDARQEQILSDRIVAMLQASLPEETARIGTDRLPTYVDDQIKLARQAGVKCEIAFANWAYLNVATNGKFGRYRDNFAIFFEERGQTVDNALAHDADKIFASYQLTVSNRNRLGLLLD